MKKSLISLILVCGLEMTTTLAQAPSGRIQPALEQRLGTLGPGERLAVIVELNEQTRVSDVAALMKGAGRHDRARAIVSALRSDAERRQGPILAHLKHQEETGLAERVKPFWIFNGLSLKAPASLIRELASRPDVKEVRLDAPIPLPSLFKVAGAAGQGAAASEWNIETIRASEVWALGPGTDGTGAVVGSFDTGVDVTHPDLYPRYRGNGTASWFDPYGEHVFPYDNHGHGTHTTGIAVGGDASGANIGVAPGARWIAAKAWNDAGAGVVSAFHEIFEWFLAPGGDPDNAPDVVNCSWGSDQSGCDTEFLPDIEALREAGILPVFAAGNSGPGAGSVTSPGAYPESFTVGATDAFDAVAYFSSQGPTPCDGSVKPDISAPGDEILSSLPGGVYDLMSGTSMAAPHVSGAVAVLRSINPGLTVEEIESALMFGAEDVDDPGPDNATGAGRLDLFVAAQIVIYGPDTPVVKVIATDAVATEAGPTAGAFTISRAGSTAADLDVHFTVGGTAVMGSDFEPIGGRVTIPAGSASAVVTVMAIDDALAERPETVSLTVEPDAAYILSGSSTAVVTIQSDELLSDLAVSALTVPSAAGAGASITLAETTKNQGAGAADASTTRFYLSANGSYDAADAPLGGRAVPRLAAGATNAGSTAVTLPQALTAGTWYIIAVADSDNAVVESSESNNVLAKPIKIGPDLIVSASTVPTTAAAGQAIALTDTTRNQGGGAAPGTSTQFYLSANSTYEASDVLLGGRAVAGLAAGASSAGSATVTIPADTPAGIWYIIAKADGDEAVSETLETNNTLGKSIKIGPDLIVSALTAPATGGAGVKITVTDTTKNQGGGAAAAFRTLIYGSTDSVLGSSDVLLGARSVAGLAAGATSSGSTTVTVPEGTPIGTWFIIVKADGDSSVEETYETNNLLNRSIAIGPDLVVSAITAPATSGAGQTIAVTDTVKNQGGGEAASSTARIYLSEDTSLDAADMLLGSHGVAALAAGKTASGTVNVTVPAGTAMGTWYLLAASDADGAVTETVESNNVMARSIKLGPDLVVTAITAPAAGGAGQAITVTDTTKNQGGGAAAVSRTAIYLSSNSTYEAADVFLGARDLGSLEAGAGSSGPATVTIPAGTTTGNWYLIARADDGLVVPETIETNNTYAKAIAVGPDLDITAMTGPTSAAAGQTITLSETVKNIGGGAAPSTVTHFYLSQNSTLDASDVLLGTRGVVALAAGASNAGAASVVIPAGTAAGTYYIIAKTDGPGVVTETSESNNTFLKSLKVT
jgi:subtilase family serine protease